VGGRIPETKFNGVPRPDNPYMLILWEFLTKREQHHPWEVISGRKTFSKVVPKSRPENIPCSHRFLAENNRIREKGKEGNAGDRMVSRRKATRWGGGQI